jgi:hypothetical protein
MNRFVKIALTWGAAITLVAGLLILPGRTVQASSPLNIIVQSVVSDALVHVETVNFPANETYTVRMGAAGTQGIGGSVVANFDTNDQPASGFHIFEIPTNLKGITSIDLRIDTADGLVGVATFTNHSSEMASVAGVGGIPTINVTSVVMNSMVTVAMNNLPASTTFDVRMGAAGTQGIAGNSTAKFDSGDGGSAIHTFDIPVSLIGSDQIDIRIEAPGGFFAYTTFTNQNTVNPNLGVGGLSNIVVNSVIGNAYVAVTTQNLPANVTYRVRIGPAGGQGNDGSVVANFGSGENGGSSIHIFEIPTSLYGSEKLDLRIDAPGGVASWVEFANVTTP